MMSKPTHRDFLKQQEVFYEEHVKYHPANAFCGTAGQEEMRHVQKLVDRLSDGQLKELINKSGVHFQNDTFDRDTFEGMIDEIDREDFYRLYRLIANE